MYSISYRQRRGQIETYFDRTAAEAWSRLTSDAPVSRIRETVRAGRDRMRALILASLPDDLTGKRVLDAGCGTGAFALEAARRGAHVTAIDIAPTLVQLARDRAAEGALDMGRGDVDFLVGDMLDPSLGHFDHVVAMDSLIHYRTQDVVAMLATLAPRVSGSMLVTFAPRTPALTAMHMIGRLFPKGDRAPSIEPVDFATLSDGIARNEALAGWDIGPTDRIVSGFYLSQLMRLERRGLMA